jgi:hypothetical protein
VELNPHHNKKGVELLIGWLDLLIGSFLRTRFGLKMNVA